jgi:hypothetical protein
VADVTAASVNIFAVPKILFVIVFDIVSSPFSNLVSEESNVRAIHPWSRGHRPAGEIWSGKEICETPPSTTVTSPRVAARQHLEAVDSLILPRMGRSAFWIPAAGGSKARAVRSCT